MAEFAGMPLGALKKMAIAEGLEKSTLEAADDEEEPDAEVKRLILENRERKAKTREVDPMAEFAGMALGALKKMAVAEGLEKSTLEAADDEDDPEAEVKRLILENRELKAKPPEVDPMAEFAGMALGALKKMAVAEGLVRSKIDEDVDDADDPKTEVKKLILGNRERKATTHRNGSWTNTPPLLTVPVVRVREDVHDRVTCEATCKARCRSCNAEFRNIANFCRQCRTPRDPPLQERRPCPFCGGDLRPGANYCRKETCHKRRHATLSEPTYSEAKHRFAVVKDNVIVTESKDPSEPKYPEIARLHHTMVVDALEQQDFRGEMRAKISYPAGWVSAKYLQSMAQREKSRKLEECVKKSRMEHEEWRKGSIADKAHYCSLDLLETLMKEAEAEGCGTRESKQLLAEMKQSMAKREKSRKLEECVKKNRMEHEEWRKGSIAEKAHYCSLDLLETLIKEAEIGGCAIEESKQLLADMKQEVRRREEDVKRKEEEVRSKQEDANVRSEVIQALSKAAERGSLMTCLGVPVATVASTGAAADETAAPTGTVAEALSQVCMQGHPMTGSANFCMECGSKPRQATPVMVPASERTGTVLNKDQQFPDVVLWSLDNKAHTKMLNGDKVTIIDEIDDRYKVRWNDQVGLVKQWHIQATCSTPVAEARTVAPETTSTEFRPPPRVEATCSTPVAEARTVAPETTSTEFRPPPRVEDAALRSEVIKALSSAAEKGSLQKSLGTGVQDGATSADHGTAAGFGTSVDDGRTANRTRAPQSPAASSEAATSRKALEGKVVLAKQAENHPEIRLMNAPAGGRGSGVKAIAKVPNGERLKVLEVVGDSVKVRWKNQDGQKIEGWATAKNLVPQAASILPDDTVQWTWGDQGALSEMVSWSSWSQLGATINELAKYEGKRPVKLRTKRSDSTIDFDTVDEARIALQARQKQTTDYEAPLLTGHLASTPDQTPGAASTPTAAEANPHRKLTWEEWHALEIRQGDDIKRELQKLDSTTLSRLRLGIEGGDGFSHVENVIAIAREQAVGTAADVGAAADSGTAAGFETAADDGRAADDGTAAGTAAAAHKGPAPCQTIDTITPDIPAGAPIPTSAEAEAEPEAPSP